MAVAVDEMPHVILDEEYRIVEVGPAAQAGFGPLLGQNVLECFPGSRPLFLPYYWETLGMLDVLTLDGLRMSLQAALQAVTDSEEALRRESVRRSLRVVEGSG